MGEVETSLMESGAATEGTSAAAQLAECCSISLAEAASFLETTDGSIPAAADLYFASVAQQGPEHRRDQEEPTPKSTRLSSGSRLHFGHLSVDSVHSAMREWLMMQAQRPQ